MKVVYTMFVFSQSQTEGSSGKRLKGPGSRSKALLDMLKATGIVQ